MVRNIKETYLPKTGMQKSSFLQDPGYVKDVKGHASMKLNSLIFAKSTLDDNYPVLTSLALKVSKFLQSLIDFTEIRPVSTAPTLHSNYLKFIYLIMPKPVHLMTVQEAHKEYN